MNLKRAATVALLAVLATALALLPAVSATAAPPTHDTAAGKDASSYWTKKRMRNAKSLDVVRNAAPAELRASGLIALAERAAGSQSSGTEPTLNFRHATSVPGSPPAGISRRIVAPAFTTGQVPPELMTTYPYSANGRIFGSFRRGGNYSCSATVVASASRSVAITAGHCLHDQDLGWARRITFAPAYLDGATPYGTWNVGRKVVTRGWFRSQNFHGDYGAVKLNGPGVIGDVVGMEGLAWNQAREQNFHAIGYPVNLGDTELMWNCISPSAGVDPLDRTRGAPDTGIGCNMGGGSSGGGWTIYDASFNAYVNGVTSYGYKRLKNILFAPYFNGKVPAIVDQADAG